MNLENIIKEQAVGLKSARRSIDIAPDLPENMLIKWSKAYRKVWGDDITDNILVLSYTGTGSFALTGNAFYYDNYMDGGMKRLRFEEIVSATAEKGGLFSTDKVSVMIKGGRKIYLDGCIDGIDIDLFAKILTYIVQQAQKGIEFKVSKQNVSLYELSEEIKTVYLKILCNYAYLDDEVIGPGEYNAIAGFSVRMEIGERTRKAVRKYRNNISGRIKTGYLLKEAKSLMAGEAGQWDAFRYSLLQDVLYIHNIQSPNKKWTEDGFVGSLMQACALRPEQIDTMVTANGLNEKMQKKDADLTELKKQWKHFLEEIRYTQKYVPGMYLFCSGSIYGVKSYTGFLKSDETSQKAINKQRELILQDIITNNQKTINVLIDDMNDLAERLEDAISGGKELQKRLISAVKSLAKAMGSIKEKNEKKESELKTVSLVERI